MYLHLVDFYGKCTGTYTIHEWYIMVWVVVPYKHHTTKSELRICFPAQQHVITFATINEHYFRMF